MNRVWKALAGLVRSDQRRNEWEPVIRSGRPPLQMRKRGTDGKWIYRDPTPKESLDYLNETQF